MINKIKIAMAFIHWFSYLFAMGIKHAYGVVSCGSRAAGQVKVTGPTLTDPFWEGLNRPDLVHW